MSLRDRTVLITRSAEQSAGLAAEVERRGGKPLLIPTIRILDPESWDACDAALSRLASYDGILFTSVNAVERFFSRASGVGLDAALPRSKKLWAVGKKTALAIEKESCAAAAIPAEFNAAAMAGMISAHGAKGARFLYPRSDIGREDLIRELEKHGATVDPVVFYRTALPEPGQVALLARRLAEGGVDVLTFTSPSTVRNFFNSLPPEIRAALPGRPKVAVIGRTTDRAVRDIGWTPDIVASEATDEGLADAIDRFFSEHA